MSNWQSNKNVRPPHLWPAGSCPESSKVDLTGKVGERRDSGKPSSPDDLPDCPSGQYTLLPPPALFLRSDSGYSSSMSSSCSSQSPCSPRGSLDSGMGESSLTAQQRLDSLASCFNSGLFTATASSSSSMAAPFTDNSIQDETDHGETEEDYCSSQSTTPTNSPNATRLLQATHELQRQELIIPAIQVSNPLLDDYQTYLDTFFRLFVKGLNLREDTVYVAFNAQQVDSLGFGLNSKRVIPCIKVYTRISSDQHAALLREVAMHISAAVKEVEREELTVDDCLQCLEIDDYENSIFRPEDLMSYPGEQFTVPEASRSGINGTVGYYMKAELTVSRGRETISCTKHFAITCAHCVLPVHYMKSLIKDACDDPTIKEQFENCHLADDLYQSMWDHEEHRRRSFLSRFLSSSSKKQEYNNPLMYRGFTLEQEECLEKGAICSQAMRKLIRNRVSYSDHTNSQYEYVLSKFGMIPKCFSMPLPGYLFKEPKSDLYHLPFNVDVGVLEHKGMSPHEKTHCLETALARSFGHTSTVATVNGIFDEKEHSYYLKLNSKRCMNQAILITPPTSGQVQAPPTPDAQPVSDYGKSAQNSLQSSSDCNKCTTSPQPFYHHHHQTAHDNSQGSTPAVVRRKESFHEIKSKQLCKAVKTTVATGRNIFSDKEQDCLYLQVMSHQGRYDRRPMRRTIKVKNDQFCLEFVHRNPQNRRQLRSFPTIKWQSHRESSGRSDDFIIEGDSGSSLFIVADNTQEQDQLVLLGIAGSPCTGTRVDFIKDSISPDLFLYMSSELLSSSSSSCPPYLRSAIEKLQERVNINEQLKELASSTEKEKICQRIRGNCLLMKSMESSLEVYPSSSDFISPWGRVTFKLTECIKDCS